MWRSFFANNPVWWCQWLGNLPKQPLIHRNFAKRKLSFRVTINIYATLRSISLNTILINVLLYVLNVRHFQITWSFPTKIESNKYIYAVNMARMRVRRSIDRPKPETGENAFLDVFSYVCGTLWLRRSVIVLPSKQ